MNRRYPPHASISLFQYLFTMIQIIIGSRFPATIPHLPPWDQYFVDIFFFGTIAPSGARMPAFITLAVVNLASSLFLVSVFLDYRLNRLFRPWQLRTLRFWHGNAYNCFILPNVRFAFASIAHYSITDSFATLLIMFLGISAAVVSFAVAFQFAVLLNETPFLFSLPFTLWRAPSYFRVVFLYSVPIGLCALFEGGGAAPAHALCAVLLAGVCAYATYEFSFFPFSGQLPNTAAASVGAASALSALLTLVRAAGGDVSAAVLVFAPYAFFGAALLVVGLPFGERRAAMVGGLRADAEATEAQRQAQLASLCIDSARAACCYLQLGLEGGCELLLDGALVRHVFERFPDDEDLMVFAIWIVSFFPCDVGLRPLLFAPAVARLSRMRNRSLLFQVSRVQLLRQSTTSRRLMNDFVRVREQSDLVVAAHAAFWRALARPRATADAAIAALAHLTRARAPVEVAWSHMADKYPNNSGVFHAYSAFLVEVPCSFPAAIRRHKRAEAIEQGARVPDRVFTCFVRAFPFYLRQGILDARGKVRKDASSGGQTTSDRAATDDDDESMVDDAQGDAVVERSQLRLAMHHFVAAMASPVRRNLAAAAALRALVGLAFVVAVAVLLNDIAAGEQALFARLRTVIRLRETVNVAMPLIPIAWAQGFIPGAFDAIAWLVRIPGFLDAHSAPAFDLFNLSTVGLKLMNELSRELYTRAHGDGDEAIALAQLLAGRAFTAANCNRSSRAISYRPGWTTIDFSLRQLFIALSKLAIEDAAGWGGSYTMCSLFARVVGVVHSFHGLTAALSPLYGVQYEKIENDSFDPHQLADEFADVPAADSQLLPRQNSFSIMISLTPALVVLMLFPLLVLATFGWRKEQEEQAALLLSFSVADREAASQKLGAVQDAGGDPETMNAQSAGLVVPKWVPSVVVTLLLTACLLIPLIEATTITARINTMLHHYALFDALRSAAAEAVEYTLVAIILNQTPEPVTFWDVDASRDLVTRALTEIVLLHELLNAGYQDVSSALGFNEELDLIRFGEKCTAEAEEVWPVAYVACLSLHRVLALLCDTAAKTIASYSRIKIPGLDPDILAFLYMTRFSLGMREVAVHYEGMFQTTLTEFRTVLWIMAAAAMVLAIVGFFADRYMVSVIDREFDTFKSLLLRTPPLAFVDVLFGKYGRLDVTLISGSQAVFQTSPDAMIALSKDGVIENVNPGASVLFGFTPEQMLGQELPILINADVTSNSNLYYTIKLMRSGQAQLVYETDVVGTKDDESNFPLRVVLVGFAAKDQDIESFAMICKDLSAEHRDNELVEEAKKETETLLHALIPQEMLTRIANHEPRFTLPVASVLVIDIVQSRSYISIASQDSISALLGNWTKLFDSFAGVIHDFQALENVAILGDLYFVVSGLFARDAEVTPYAHELVHFALRCFDKTEEFNVQMGTSLQLRMGIHTGGPLFVGVVDDRTLFNVVGGPIRTAQTLEKIATPGTVRISAATYDCICNGSFHIEKHEDAFVGDEGVIATYTVTYGLRVSRQGSKRNKSGFGLAQSASGHGSMCQVPFDNAVESARAQPVKEYTVSELLDVHEPPSLDADQDG